MAMAFCEGCGRPITRGSVRWDAEGRAWHECGLEIEDLSAIWDPRNFHPAEEESRGGSRGSVRNSAAELGDVVWRLCAGCGRLAERAEFVAAVARELLERGRAATPFEAALAAALYFASWLGCSRSVVEAARAVRKLGREGLQRVENLAWRYVPEALLAALPSEVRELCEEVAGRLGVSVPLAVAAVSELLGLGVPLDAGPDGDDVCAELAASDLYPEILRLRRAFKASGGWRLCATVTRR